MKYVLILALTWSIYPQQRELDTGFGWVVDDLECHAHTGHPMKNAADPGNWVHELTHQVNSDLRITKGHNTLKGKYVNELTRQVSSDLIATHGGYNAFYILKGRYVLLKEPNFTLKDVAKEVPQSERGGLYSLYLVDQARYWNASPLYVLDEATAYLNGFTYHVASKTRDDYRRDGMNEFVNYAKALLRTTEKLDPKYKDMDQLRNFVSWLTLRAKTLTAEYDGAPVPDPVPDPNDYIFHGVK